MLNDVKLQTKIGVFLEKMTPDITNFFFYGMVGWFGLAQSIWAY